ncbi:hypothetical protein Z043_121010 [Scleropages formosus]|uniref:Serine aminopeptidase S33 domain-containing protein n=1 Tax=Scleropages formosus TaxID=113540 RepID=A0A0P7WIE2_SCLFO|nr:hypothetical protein Z043_121010 [Scleropages formosus]
MGALLFVAHGMGEHCGRYGALAHSLTQHGIMVFAHDHGRGHLHPVRVREARRVCRSGPDLTHGPHEPRVGHALQGVRREAPEPRAAEPDAGFRGVQVDLPGQEGGTSRRRAMAACLSERRSLVSAGQRSTPPVLQVELYDTDELNHHGGLSVALGMQLMGAVQRIAREIPTVSWPFLLLHERHQRVDCPADPETAVRLLDPLPPAPSDSQWPPSLKLILSACGSALRETVHLQTTWSRWSWSSLFPAPLPSDYSPRSSTW